MSNHTPGPWKASQPKNEYGGIKWAIHTGQKYSPLIGTLAFCYRDADAELIIRAPELLEQVNTLKNEMKELTNKIIDEAIDIITDYQDVNPIVIERLKLRKI